LFINKQLNIAAKHGTKDAVNASPASLDLLRNETSKSSKRTGGIDSCHDLSRRLRFQKRPENPAEASAAEITRLIHDLDDEAANDMFCARRRKCAEVKKLRKGVVRDSIFAASPLNCNQPDIKERTHDHHPNQGHIHPFGRMSNDPL